MRIKISSLKGKKGASIVFSDVLDVQSLEVEPPVTEFLDPIDIEGKIVNTGAAFLVEGRLTGRALLQCTRCLKNFEQDFDLTFEDQFFADAKQLAEFSNEQEDYLGDQSLIIKNDEIDLSNLLTDSLTLAFPMQVICSEECRGLCAICGGNLNESQCSCEENQTDPRLAPLADFFKKQERRKENGSS
ncbi:MAG: DUF177 domain-containing protein [Firmicutes bacterium]|nr:DUF177 domain-containing protein [Bacillota bacterium]